MKGKKEGIAIQYTLYCTTGQYRPVSCILVVDSVKEVNENPKLYKRKAIEKICLKRYWTSKDLERYGYTQIKCRIYQPNALDK